MAKVAGLTPFTDDLPGAARVKRGRVSTPDASRIKAPGLSPTMSPVDTYARPAAPVDNHLDSLAEALGSLNPALQRFGMAQAMESSDSRAKALKVLQTMPRDQLDKGIANGTIPEFKTMAGMEVYGEERAYYDLTELERRWNEETDKDNGDVDRLIRDVTGESLNTYGKDSAFLSTYTERLQAGLQRFKSGVSEYRSKRVLETRADSVFNAWHGRADFMAAEGKTPDEVAQSIYGDFQKNKVFLRLPFKDQQGMILQLADQMATRGKYDNAKALLMFERSDGAYKGSLMSDRDLGKQATDLYGRIEADQSRQRLKENADKAEAELDTILISKVVDGSISAVTDVQVPNAQGDMKTYTPDQLRKRAANLAVEASRAQATRSGENPDQTYAREVREFAGSGLEHPQWFQTINAGFTTSTINNLTGDNLPPALVDGYGLYKKLHTDAPQYVGKFTNKDAIDFYEAARVAEEDLGQDTKNALLMASIATRDPNENSTLTNARFEDLDDAVDDAIDKTESIFNIGGVFSYDNQNTSTVKAEVSRYAKLYARMGLDVGKSLSLAQDRFAKNFINVNGTFIRDDPRLPADFRPLVEQKLKEFVDKYGDKIDAGLEDLSILPATNGSGGYIIFNRNHYATYATLPEANITMQILEDLRKANSERREGETVTNANKKPRVPKAPYNPFGVAPK